jgi:hypothetical protein
MTLRTFDDVSLDEPIVSLFRTTWENGSVFFGRPDVIRDHGEHHRAFAEQERGPVLPGQFITALFTQLVDEWAGANAAIDEVRSAFRRPLYAGNEVERVGRVTGKREEHGRRLVDIEVAALVDGEPIAMGTVTVAFGA